MKQPENEPKNKNLNNSMQFSQKTFNHQLILTDYNIYNFIDNNNNSYKTIKIKKPKNDLNNSNLIDKKNKIVVNYNLSKIHPNIVAKNIFPNYAMKTLVAHKTNNSLENKNITDINKNKKKGRKIIQNPVNSKIASYSSHTKEKSNFKANLKNNKNSESKDKNYMVIQNGGRINRNLNLTLTNFSSIGGTEFKKDFLDKSPKQYNLSISNKHDKKSNDEIIIKRKSINTTKNKLNKKLFGKMNLNDINNYNLNLNNFNNFNNININNNSTLSNKNSNNNSMKFQKRKSNKTNLSSSSSKFYGSSLKSNSKYSVNKKFDILKNNMNEQISDINNNYNKLKNMTESDNVKKHELIFDIIQNSLFKFASILSNPKEKEVAFEIIQKLNDFFKKNTTLVNAIKKKNDELNEKIRKCKEINKHIEKENILLEDKIDIMQRKIEDLENEIKNNIFNDNGNNKDNGNGINDNNKVNNIIFENGNDYIQEQNENENDDSYEKEENESSVNSEELESIRFFDKIIMKKHSFSKAHIPELEIKQIKLNEELENKQNHNGKINNYKLRNKFNFKNGIYINKQKEKEFQNGLRKKGNKSSKAIGYSKIAEDKKKKSYKKFQGIK